MSDILRLLGDVEIHAIIERCGRDLPNSILGYNFLHMYIKWQRIIDNPVNSEFVSKLNSDTVWRKVYTKRNGVAENCTFVSISGDRDLSIYVFSHDPNELKECLKRTKLINWAKGPAFAGFASKHYHNIVDIVHEKGLTLQYDIVSDGYYLPQEAALKFNVNLTDDIRIDSIQAKDYDTVNKLWTYCYPESDKYMKCLILLNENIAVYSKDSDEIKSWGIIDELYSVAMLHTKPEFTRNGYASVVIKSLARILAEKYNMGTFCFITRGNTNSRRCFLKLGFEQLNVPGDLIWVKVIPTN